ncbi:MAG: tetratricopeptide repeat-containing glycosyltransferase family protein [Tepidisphaeraceae bacterium]|jgi:hypothetical protein
MAASESDWLGYVKQARERLAQNQYDEAYGHAQKALTINPHAAMAHQVIGLVLLERDEPNDALAALHKAISLRPDLLPSHNGLGRIYLMLGDLDRALDHFNRLLHIQPDHASAHFSRACVWLKQGRYKEGWLEYEWRWPAGLVAKPPIPRPRWDGSPLAGRSILIHTEQGMGDVLQFIRLLPLVKSQAGQLVFACQKAMQELLRPTPCVDHWFPIDEPSGINFDVYAPLVSLPGLLGIDEKTIPHSIPYVFPDPQRVERWRRPIQELPGFKIGLAWQGSPTFEGDRIRSIPLKQFAPLSQVPSTTLISLQKGVGVEQIEPNRPSLPLHVLGDLDQQSAFVDRAAIMTHLDLIITSDTSVAHLAGALGRPVWVLLSTGCDWRWLTARSDSPWYPTMRLYRQKTLGDWPTVFAEVAADLRSIASQRVSG